jgi:predicted short-subunit dehydrogenase-like oxidoreductase (DUF2520 family)
MKISIIGAGRVGQTLGRLAHEAEYDIGDVVCRTLGSARRAVKFIGGGQAQSFARLALSEADMLFITTPDDHIAAVVECIRQSHLKRAIALHTSGALSSDILQPLKANDFAIGSCHPLQSFASPVRALPLISQTYFCIEGDERAVRQARRFVKAIGAQHFTIVKEKKNLYHAAAVLASGGVTTLISAALELLSHCGLSEKEARRVLLPLVTGTLQNLASVGAAKALTGPVSRGDAGTVQKNLLAIAEVDRTVAELYRLLALHSLKLAEEAGTSSTLLDEVRRVLQVPFNRR